MAHYKIGEVYDFDGTKRKVIGFDGINPITTVDINADVNQHVLEMPDADALRAEIRAELIEEFERDYHARPASPEAFRGLLSLMPLDKCNKDELQAIAAYMGEEIPAEADTKAEIIAILLGD